MPAQDYTNHDDEKNVCTSDAFRSTSKKVVDGAKSNLIFFHAIVTPAARYGAGATEIHCCTVDGQIFKP